MSDPASADASILYATPRAHLLSNGRYTVMLTAAGSGYSQWRGCAITRWREDPTRDPWGTYLYLQDVASGATWSAGHQPVGRAADAYSVAFEEGRAVIDRRDGDIGTTTEIMVGDDDVELRRVTLHNHGTREATIDFTSYAELVLAPPAGDAAHPAFSKLFVRTEWLPDAGLLLATRRVRTPGDPSACAAQWLAVEGDADSTTRDGAIQFETDRAAFIGRGRDLRVPAAIVDGKALAGGIGTVLDPIFSLRRRVRVPAGAAVVLGLWTAAADSRDEVLALAERCRRASPAAMIEGALHRARSALEGLGIDAAQARRFQRLASALLYSDPALRAAPEAIAQGQGGAPTLWAAGISGDRPIVLLHVRDEAGLPLVDDALRAHAFWTGKCLATDLVVLVDASAATTPALHDALQRRVAAHVGNRANAEARPDVFILRGEQVSAGLAAGLSTVARIVLEQSAGTLAEQVDALPEPTEVVDTQRGNAPVSRGGANAAQRDIDETLDEAGLEFFNGYGGFDNDGREYVTLVRDGQRPPMPWLNVVANADFGFTTTEAGGGYAWALNSQRNTLTPWANDPVVDPPQEVLYLRDEDDGRTWTATALSGGDRNGTYEVRHGQGYSRFRHRAHGIELELLQYVPVADGIKISRLKLRNRSGRARRLSITAFVQWALGANGTQPAPFVETRIDPGTGALFARNAWRPEFGERVAFMDLRGQQASYTGDRAEFLGRHGTLAAPAALQDGEPLSGRVGAGLDPCGALQARIELATDGEGEIALLFGDAGSDADAGELIRRYRDADLDDVLRDAMQAWDDILDTVQVKTPDRAMDLLLNRWLLYQALGCRVWARTGYYQASGAYGFRDQLQDVMAVCVARPDEARAQLLRAAARQFIEGDVQHWWLPPGGEGVRTRMTDDRLWLPFVASHYVETTADAGILDTRQPFLAGETLKPGQDEAFFRPSTADVDASLYEHCALAIDISLSLGAHGLPLFGTGDWNDGMNRVGEEGRGESSWLGWFLAATIDAFAPHAIARGEHERAQRWQACAASVRKALDAGGWDGGWYRRGYYDDGTPLGSHDSSECRIDAIAQSWSVIAGGGDPNHARTAMQAVDEHLVWREQKLAPLFTPPFEHVDKDPGYIKAYPPGIRENGGQYTHGSQWSIFALAKLGEGDRAGELFSLINPIHHAGTREAIERYKVEPYVACADVYSVAPHVGRGGWTWYTGSGAWLYRAGLEAILGFRVQGAQLCIDPCIPHDWPGFSIEYRHGASRYLVEVANPGGASRGIARASLDGEALAVDPCMVPLRDDGAVHRVAIELGE
jgi:cellobiose phosphorylase